MTRATPQTTCKRRYSKCIKKGGSRKRCKTHLAKCSRNVVGRSRRQLNVRLGHIVNDADQPSTPKKVAQEMLIDGVSITRGYWTERYTEQDDKLTIRERGLIDAQLKKQGDRIARMFGYEESWRS